MKKIIFFVVLVMCCNTVFPQSVAEYRKKRQDSLAALNKKLPVTVSTSGASNTIKSENPIEDPYQNSDISKKQYPQSNVQLIGENGVIQGDDIHGTVLTGKFCITQMPEKGKRWRSVGLGISYAQIDVTTVIHSSDFTADDIPSDFNSLQTEIGGYVSWLSYYGKSNGSWVTSEFDLGLSQMQTKQSFNEFSSKQTDLLLKASWYGEVTSPKVMLSKVEGCLALRYPIDSKVTAVNEGEKIMIDPWDNRSIYAMLGASVLSFNLGPISKDIGFTVDVVGDVSYGIGSKKTNIGGTVRTSWFYEGLNVVTVSASAYTIPNEASAWHSYQTYKFSVDGIGLVKSIASLVKNF